MEPTYQPDNGIKEVRTLPAMQLAQGPEWRMPADIAVRFIQAIYDKHPDQAANAMHFAMTGQELRARGARRGGSDG
jgi:hypothetical protein